MRVSIAIEAHDHELGEVAGVTRELVVVPDHGEELVAATGKVLVSLIDAATAEAVEQVARTQDRVSAEGD